MYIEKDVVISTITNWKTFELLDIQIDSKIFLSY